MDNLYLFIVIILFVLAISDLIVGVSNDAVNFLNSAIGSRVAPFRTIMIIAAAGILVGATFSSGMMEVARKGIFHPHNFYFSEIMIIFLAVMITDIILLDLFNTLGLPTSTTVSIVFELLGSAVGIALIKLRKDTEGLYAMSDYINSDNALLIIFGILLSVVVAFSVGAIVQYISRIIFSFNYEKVIKYFGSVWGGIAITAITYFMLLKGAKGASFMTESATTWFKENTSLVILYSFLGWTVLLQLLNFLFKINILKVIVLAGTFALAMAFAGNDLVNFIGVPLAGFESFKSFSEASGADPGTFSMGALQEKVKTPTYFLLIAGLVMVATLWLSKKAKSVVKTTIDLSRQDEGSERFESSALARSIVRGFMSFAKLIASITPKGVKNYISKRFDQQQQEQLLKEKNVAFDLIRASVNLVVASILIAFATSKKLPLSTTYVTFMVAMGTSLADGAWGRESAVYRISGVVTVIGGWFFTAFMAFTVAFIVANLISFGGVWAIIGLIFLAITFIVRTHIIHKKRVSKEKQEATIESITFDKSTVFNTCNDRLKDSVKDVQKIYDISIEGLLKEKLKHTNKAIKLNKKFIKQTDSYRKEMYESIKNLEGDAIDTGIYIVQVFDSMKEASVALNSLIQSVNNHVDNNHSPMKGFQQDYTSDFSKNILDYFELYSNLIVDTESKSKEKFEKLKSKIENMTSDFKKHQIKMINQDGVGKKTSILFLDILASSKIIVHHLDSIMTSQEKFAKTHLS